MKTISIDFTEIGDFDDFYALLKEKMSLPDNFGNNLDALYDFITGYTELPVHLEFVNMSVDQLETFDELLLMMEDAEDILEPFGFSYYLEQYEDGE